jgi:hypothetical protein
MRNINFQDESKNMLTKTLLFVKMATLYEQPDKISTEDWIYVLFILLDNILKRFNCNIQQQTTYLKK